MCWNRNFSRNQSPVHKYWVQNWVEHAGDSRESECALTRQHHRRKHNKFLPFWPSVYTATHENGSCICKETKTLAKVEVWKTEIFYPGIFEELFCKTRYAPKFRNLWFSYHQRAEITAMSIFVITSYGWKLDNTVFCKRALHLSF